MTNSQRPVEFNHVGHGTETVVQLVEGGNEPPLIIIHGGGGALQPFEPMKKQFKTRLWGIQITPTTPLHTISAQAHFYFVKIKEKQLHGPYRLCAFSASSILLVSLARIFEENGDRIIQLAFIDHFPTVFLCPEIGVHASGEHVIDRPMARERFIANSFRSVCDITRRDGGGTARRHELAQDLMNAFNGEAASDFAKTFFRTMELYLGAVFDLVIDMSERRDAESLMEGLTAWIKSLKATATVYIASNGVLGEIPTQHRREWWDLGVGRCLLDPKVVYLDAGHYDVLSSKKLIRDLQTGYAPVGATL
ncbi:Alpha/Beta hydrolase protein [Mycena albidolilacea]|uniref:Alpha/Beta hydrolase protein n=1 Tax=Mycena albidolilacea TaxID=1033008 RepID=A0AAD7EGT9_9AGAR|nr:Alpha/Beta hydrolase protein [Mycena albidolilacea]